jgi:hypothetical protein
MFSIHKGHLLKKCKCQIPRFLETCFPLLNSGHGWSHLTTSWTWCPHAPWPNPRLFLWANPFHRFLVIHPQKTPKFGLFYSPITLAESELWHVFFTFFAQEKQRSEHTFRMYRASSCSLEENRAWTFEGQRMDVLWENLGPFWRVFCHKQTYGGIKKTILVGYVYLDIDGFGRIGYNGIYNHIWVSVMIS